MADVEDVKNAKNSEDVEKAEEYWNINSSKEELH